MPPILQPVRRRRRRRTYWRRRLGAALVLVGIAALSSAWLLTGHRTQTRAALGAKPTAPPAGTPAPKEKPQPQPEPEPEPVPLHLLTGAPPPHTFTPPLSGKAAIVIDASTGRVIWSQNPHERLAIASLTKIMTALVVLERLPLDTTVHIGWTVPRVPLVSEGLRVGENVPASKLLYGLLLYSGNDDALALGIATAGSRPAFLALMNRRAHELGLEDSHFTSTSGVIDDGNYSSVSDLAALTLYARRDPRFRAIVRKRVKHVSWEAPTYSKIYVNKNRFLHLYPGANGVKTGWTTLSGPCVVESATRQGVTLIAVVLDSAHQYNDAARLLNYGYSVVSASPGFAMARP